jgi:lysozyme family protein
MPFVPYVAGHDPDFDKCLPPILTQEGGLSNSAHDPGGLTDHGITQREYNVDRRSWGLQLRSVAKISQAEYSTIYYTKYWLPHCPFLRDIGLKLEFFNMAVNGGPTEAIRLLQRSLMFPSKFVDGVWGPKTLSGVNAIYKYFGDVIGRYKRDADAFYEELPGFRWFGRDWLRRDTEITQQADTLDAALDAILKPQASIIKGDKST